MLRLSAVSLVVIAEKEQAAEKNQTGYALGYSSPSGILILAQNQPSYRPAARDKLNPGQTLRRGEYLLSSNDRYRLIMQDDGNLVLYAGNQALWASNTDGQAVEKCIMQPDGNLVLYLYNGQPVWASNTHGKPGSFLWLQNDGNVVIYHPVWASNAAR